MRTPRAAINQAAALRQSSTMTVHTDNTTMKALYETLIEYKEEGTGRALISLFMSLPSRKDYPDYYEFIKVPIAMNTIHDKLEKNKYPNEEALMDDFKLMFNNCKSYNEDGSQIYNDAVTLESVLNKRWKMFERAQESAMAEQQLLDHHHHHHHLNHNNSHHNNNNNHLQLHNNQQHNLTYHHNSHQQQHNNSHRSGHQLTSGSQQLQNGKSINTVAASTNTTNNNNNSTTTINTTTNTAHITTTPSSLPSPRLASSLDPSATLIHQDSNMSFDGSNTSSTLNSQLNSAALLSLNGINNSSTNNSNQNHQNNNHHHAAITPKETSNMSTSDTTPATPTPHNHTPGRRHRNSDAPKRQLLTGYIIYASEIRKRVIDKNPDQSFGDISRLVGTEWKMLPHEIKSKYEQRALAHNAKVREKAQADAAERELNGITIDPNPVQTPKLSKRKAAQLAKEQLRQHGLNHNNSLGGPNDTSMSGLTPNSSQSHQSSLDCLQSNSNHHHGLSTQLGSSSMTPQSHAQQQGHHHHNIHMMPGQTQAFQQQQHHHHLKPTTQSVGIQTNPPTLRFVAPPPKKRLVYSETFKNYIEQLRPDCLHVSKWQKVKQMKSTSEHVSEEHFSAKTLANGIGKHESTAAALWALRDYMLKDALNIANDCDLEY